MSGLSIVVSSQSQCFYQCTGSLKSVVLNDCVKVTMNNQTDIRLCDDCIKALSVHGGGGGEGEWRGGREGEWRKGVGDGR